MSWSCNGNGADNRQRTVEVAKRHEQNEWQQLNDADVRHSQRVEKRTVRTYFTCHLERRADTGCILIYVYFTNYAKYYLQPNYIRLGVETQAACGAGRPSSVGSFQPNKRLRLDIFSLNVIFTEWRSVWLLSSLNQRSAEKIRSDFVTRALVVRSSLLGFRLRGRWC